ncbi:MAG: hypothetical protein AAGA56_04675 [Myxococcota bacterium]
MAGHKGIQWQKLSPEAWIQGNRALARQLGVCPKTVRWARKRYAPDAPAQALPEGHAIKGVSTLVRANGETVLQWIKTDRRRQELLEQLARIAEPLRGEKDPVTAPDVRRLVQDLMAVILWGDPHCGALAWPAETGNRWDLAEFERLHVASAHDLVRRAPACEELVLVTVGDTFHANDRSGLTPRNKHVLDVDSRFPKALLVARRTFRLVIDLAREKFARVRVVILPGNHDPDASFAMAMILDALYDREPRVTVDLRPAKYRHLQWGANLLCFGHGDTRKMAALGGIAPGMWPQAWGRTRHHHWYTGHVHNHSGMTLPDGSYAESLETLAGRDAYAVEGGWISGRSARLDVWHKELGRTEQHWFRAEWSPPEGEAPTEDAA